MRNIVDSLNEKIIKLESPIVVGLDPKLSEIPDCYKENLSKAENKLEEIENIIVNFNKDIIDSIFNIVPAVKPQIAFYEVYGEYGIRAFIKTCKYAKSKGLYVIADAKRNDIGNTAKAYAKAFIGKVDLGEGQKEEIFGTDFVTVSPYLGLDSIMPFIEECVENDKGIFVLVKTSNPSSKDIQDKVTIDGKMIRECVAEYVRTESDKLLGDTGYSPIGAVVGATFPEDAIMLRKIMKNNIFLVPGYGAQGGTAKDVMNCFNENGLGALINSSRGIIYSYKKGYEKSHITKEEYKNSVISATIAMKEDIVSNLNKAGKGYKK